LGDRFKIAKVWIAIESFIGLMFIVLAIAIAMKAIFYGYTISGLQELAFATAIVLFLVGFVSIAVGQLAMALLVVADNTTAMRDQLERIKLNVGSTWPGPRSEPPVTSGERTHFQDT